MNYISNEQSNRDGIYNNKGEIAIENNLLKNIEVEKKELIIFVLELFILVLMSLLLFFFPIQVILPYLLVLMAIIILIMLI